MIFAGILAGGTGSRMENADIPKQFIKICNVPVFIRTVKTFLSVKRIDKVVISINTDWESMYTDLLKQYDIDLDRIILTPGGDTRFKSLVNITRKIIELFPNDDSIIVSHDCARVFVSNRIIEENIDTLENFDMVTTSIPTIDTMLFSDNGIICSTLPDRTKLWNDQGPQTYRAKTFIKYVDMIPPADIESYIEASKLYLSHDRKVGIVKGDRFNFKITNDIDLRYAEFLIKGGYLK